MSWARCQPIAAWKVDSFLDFLLPERCALCSDPCFTGPVCDECASRLPWEDHHDPRTWAAFRYEPVIAQAIRALKFHAHFAPARWLGQLMARRLAARPEPLPELLIPVPLHPRRVVWRGYNQALEIARHVAPVLGMRLAPAMARRRRATEEQTHLDAPRRRRNLHGAFEVDPGVRSRHIALLDDVTTTGATLGELARAAQRAGAATVELWAVARAALRRGEVHRDPGEHREPEPVVVEER